MVLFEKRLNKVTDTMSVTLFRDAVFESSEQQKELSSSTAVKLLSKSYLQWCLHFSLSNISVHLLNTNKSILIWANDKWDVPWSVEVQHIDNTWKENSLWFCVSYFFTVFCYNISTSVQNNVYTCMYVMKKNEWSKIRLPYNQFRQWSELISPLVKNMNINYFHNHLVCFVLKKTKFFDFSFSNMNISWFI